MDILMLGSGGREHALIKKLKESPKAGKIYCAPGNGGISKDAECVNISVMDKESIITFAKEKNIDLVFVAPDDPLAAGVVDALNDAGIRAFGPVAKAAEIESSKVFSKNLMKNIIFQRLVTRFFLTLKRLLHTSRNKISSQQL